MEGVTFQVGPALSNTVGLFFIFSQSQCSCSGRHGDQVKARLCCDLLQHQTLESTSAVLEDLDRFICNTLAFTAAVALLRASCGMPTRNNAEG